jgi:hypothetical protein
MLKRAKALLVATAFASTLTVGAMGPSASAAQQTGLVNVAIEDTNVVLAPQVGAVIQVPIGVAANVCNVNVAVLSALASGTRCDSTVNQRTESAFEQIQRIAANT